MDYGERRPAVGDVDERAETTRPAPPKRAVKLLASDGIPVPEGGNFQGRRARGEAGGVARWAAEGLDRRWSANSRYDRQARVTDIAMLTPTGSVGLALEVTDDREFSFEPGNFLGIEAHFEGLGYRRSPYCIVSAPSSGRHVELVVRVVPDGPVAQYLASLRPGDTVTFRGPKGRTMVPKDRNRDLVLVATGVAVGPCLSLAAHLLSQRFDRRIDLYWGLRSPDDIWGLDALERLASRHANFAYRISLSEPHDEWKGLRGRVTHSVPPLLTTLGDKQFYLVGNGVMIAELSTALSDLGVSQPYIYEEAYFSAHHVPDPAVVAAIRDRFVADDLFSAFAHDKASLFALDPSRAARAHRH